MHPNISGSQFTSPDLTSPHCSRPFHPAAQPTSPLGNLSHALPSFMPVSMDGPLTHPTSSTETWNHSCYLPHFPSPHHPLLHQLFLPWKYFSKKPNPAPSLPSSSYNCTSPELLKCLTTHLPAPILSLCYSISHTAARVGYMCVCVCVCVRDVAGFISIGDSKLSCFSFEKMLFLQLL